MFIIPFYIKVALIFLVLGFLFHLVGFTTPYWVSYGEVHFGLWTSCFHGRCGSFSDAGSSAIGAARAFEVLACILFVVVFILLIVYLRSPDRNVGLASTICTFIIAVLIIIGVICFITRYDFHLHWSFAFTIIGAIFAFLAAIFLLIHRLKGVTVVTGGSGGTRTTRTVTTTVTYK